MRLRDAMKWVVFAGWLAIVIGGNVYLLVGNLSVAIGAALVVGAIAALAVAIDRVK